MTSFFRQQHIVAPLIKTRQEKGEEERGKREDFDQIVIRNLPVAQCFLHLFVICLCVVCSTVRISVSNFFRFFFPVLFINHLMRNALITFLLWWFNLWFYLR